MPHHLIIALRKTLGFFVPFFGTTALVFLRRGFGVRALGLKHLLFGGFLLFWIAFHVEPEDVLEGGRQRMYALELIGLCQREPGARLSGGTTCAQQLPEALARVAHRMDLHPYMHYYAVAFCLACLAQLVFSKMRERWGYDPVPSYSDGEPWLSALTFGQFPALAKILLEPALILLVARFFDTVLERHGTALFFVLVAVYLFASSFERWKRERAAFLDMQDFALATGIGEGSMHRPPTRADGGGFFAQFFRTREARHVAGLNRLRAFSLRNRARMLEDIEEPAPLQGSGAPQGIPEQPAVPEARPEPVASGGDASGPRPRR